MPITLQEFAAAINAWKDHRLTFGRENITPLDEIVKYWIYELLKLGYVPIEGSLFGDAILQYRKDQQAIFKSDSFKP